MKINNLLFIFSGPVIDIETLITRNFKKTEVSSKHDDVNDENNLHKNNGEMVQFDDKRSATSKEKKTKKKKEKEKEKSPQTTEESNTDYIPNEIDDKLSETYGRCEH